MPLVELPYLQIELEFNHATAANAVADWLQNKVDSHPKVRHGKVELFEPFALMQNILNEDGDVADSMNVGRIYYLVSIRVLLDSDASRANIFNNLKDKLQENDVIQYMETARVYGHECDRGEATCNCKNELMHEWIK